MDVPRRLTFCLLLKKLWRHPLQVLTLPYSVMTQAQSFMGNYTFKVLKATIKRFHTYLQHCFLILRPPNLGLSRQLVQTPQSFGTWQPGHCPQRRERRPFLGGASRTVFCLVTGLIGGVGGSASSDPATDDLSIQAPLKKRLKTNDTFQKKKNINQTISKMLSHHHFPWKTRSFLFPPMARH